MKIEKLKKVKSERNFWYFLQILYAEEKIKTRWIPYLNKKFESLIYLIRTVCQIYNYVSLKDRLKGSYEIIEMYVMSAEQREKRHLSFIWCLWFRHQLGKWDCYLVRNTGLAQFRLGDKWLGCWGKFRYKSEPWLPMQMSSGLLLHWWPRGLCMCHDLEKSWTTEGVFSFGVGASLSV